MQISGEFVRNSEVSRINSSIIAGCDYNVASQKSKQLGRANLVDIRRTV